jgi:hypothetical protein
MGMTRAAVLRARPTAPVELLGELLITATDVAFQPVEVRAVAVYVNVVARNSSGPDEPDPALFGSSGEYEDEPVRTGEAHQSGNAGEEELGEEGQAEQARPHFPRSQLLHVNAPTSPLRRLGSGSPNALAAPTPDQRRPLPVSLAPPERRHLSLATKRAALELSAHEVSTRPTS